MPPVVKCRFESILIPINGNEGSETESGTNTCRKCHNAKKRLPAGQIGNIPIECFRSVPREAAFLRLDGADRKSEQIGNRKQLSRAGRANILFL